MLIYAQVISRSKKKISELSHVKIPKGPNLFIPKVIARSTPPKTNMDIQNSHVWKEMH